ncbi:hypothetical protein KZ810_06355 [Sphingomonas sp. RHCKR47]|uniref:DUF6438 domain-containing protein n=1 Tax=Sphingomonas citricola TaxID=2862498 RepID=UPI001C6821AA|nr:DUF6438 domain-containing protein [Sphingomonas citricola]MBW6523116.1 hypothetical protein [Sphingomonas citricola]
MRTIILLAAAATSLSACATLPTSGRDAGQSAGSGNPAAVVERITYETSACHGTCPVYAVTVDTDTGAGEFIGTQHVAVTGASRFWATPAQVRSFVHAVAALRATPIGALEQGGTACATYAADLPGATVTWQSPAGKRDVRRVDFGCAGQTNRALFDDLRSVPRVLPIAELIGRR